MQPLRWLFVLPLIAVVSATPALPGRTFQTQPLVPVAGTWKLLSAKANDQAIEFPAGTTILKHVTPTHFVFVHYDRRGRITAAGGGRYRVTGGRYEEVVDYGLDAAMAPLIGKTQVFTIRIDGARWYHGGRETDGTAIEEVWERVPASQSKP